MRRMTPRILSYFETFICIDKCHLWYEASILQQIGKEHTCFRYRLVRWGMIGGVLKKVGWGGGVEKRLRPASMLCKSKSKLPTALVWMAITSPTNYRLRNFSNWAWVTERRVAIRPDVILSVNHERFEKPDVWRTSFVLVPGEGIREAPIQPFQWCTNKGLFAYRQWRSCLNDIYGEGSTGDQTSRLLGQI
ncbi:hypothetical protein BGX38DRAFT_583641 [Terfezia claveryi]|nr:hypothetical protein BGX38DRAFT_583641 [Terfezia claveryi]